MELTKKQAAVLCKTSKYKWAIKDAHPFNHVYWTDKGGILTCDGRMIVQVYGETKGLPLKSETWYRHKAEDVLRASRGMSSKDRLDLNKMFTHSGHVEPELVDASKMPEILFLEDTYAPKKAKRVALNAELLRLLTEVALVFDPPTIGNTSRMYLYEDRVVIQGVGWRCLLMALKW